MHNKTSLSKMKFNVSKQHVTPIVQEKKTILAWMDSPNCTTGFGIATKHILEGLQKTGKYIIEVLGINYHGSFLDKHVFPYQIFPARLQDPNDPYGLNLFLEIVLKRDYDYIFIQNDTFVVEQVVKALGEIKLKKESEGRKVFKLVYYYPIDCRLVHGAHNILELADVPVAYSEFAVTETKKILPNLPVRHIYLGVDPEVFKPLSLEERRKWRKQYFGIEDDNTFIFINVNRNSPRKDLAKTIYSFSQFNQIYPNSLLYLHAAAKDRGAGSMNEIDLRIALDHIGYIDNPKIRFPNNYSTSGGFAESVVNQLYNSADAYITTANGEGFGFSQVEAMSVGLPCIVPDNTVVPELFGGHKDRGYIYPCREHIYIDNSGYRKTGRIEDIVKTMIECYQERNLETQIAIRSRAREFAKSISWNNIHQQWIRLFDILDRTPAVKKSPGTVVGQKL